MLLILPNEIKFNHIHIFYLLSWSKIIIEIYYDKNLLYYDNSKHEKVKKGKIFL